MIDEGGYIPRGAPERGCFFSLGGLFGGGGSSTSVSSNVTTNVDVQVNPEIGVAVDTRPIAEALAGINQANASLVSSIAQGNEAAAKAIGQGLSNQASSFNAFAGALSQGFADLQSGVASSESKQAMMIFGLAALAFFFLKGKRRG